MIHRTRTIPIGIGDKVGRWTVLDKYILNSRKERKWLCRCECGTERYVLERSLRYGISQSCGCLRIERASRAAAYELTGMTFGELTVLHRAEHQREYGGVWWTCQCTCGERYDTTATLLKSGKRTCCTGTAHPKKAVSVDIAGKRFHRLTALQATPKRDARSSVIWLCRCDCGKVVEVPYNSLLYGNTKSCGCQKREYVKTLPDQLTHVAGTSVDILKSEKIPINNTTGAKGVYRIRGKWVAKIVFQRKAYYLGTYDAFDAAVEARRAAEELLNRGTVEHYARWKTRAEQDPEWAEQNPIEIRVEKERSRELTITFLPELD